MIQYLFMSNEQTHPLHSGDKDIIDSLITKEKPEDLDFINLARLINRYTNFPGEIEIKEDIKKILKFWKITKNELFTKTKNIWSKSFCRRFTSTFLPMPNTICLENNLIKPIQVAKNIKNNDLEITKSEEKLFCN